MKPGEEVRYRDADGNIHRAWYIRRSKNRSGNFFIRYNHFYKNGNFKAVRHRWVQTTRGLHEGFPLFIGIPGHR